MSVMNRLTFRDPPPRRGTGGKPRVEKGRGRLTCLLLWCGDIFRGAWTSVGR